MGRADIDIGFVPFDQRDLVERGRLLWGVAKEDPGSWTPLDPQIAKGGIATDLIVAAVKPLRNLERVLPLAIGLIGDRTFWIHVEQHCRKGSDLGRIQPIGQRADGPRLAKGIDEEFIRIDGQAPMAMAIAAQQMADPIHAKAAFLVARLGPPQGDVGLIPEIFKRPIGGAVVHHEKVIDSQVAVIAQEIRQTYPFVAQGHECKDRVCGQPGRAVGDAGQIATAGPRPVKQAPASPTKPI